MAFPGYEVRMDFTEVVQLRTQTDSLRYKTPTHHNASCEFVA